MATSAPSPGKRSLVLKHLLCSIQMCMNLLTRGHASVTSDLGKATLYMLKVIYVIASCPQWLYWEYILTFIPLAKHLKNTFQYPADPQFGNFLLTGSVSKIGLLVEN